MGNPDGPPPPHVVQKLVETLNNPRVHGYSTSRGIPGLRRALAGYYQRRFNVALDPETEVVVTLGSKEGLANLAQAIVGAGRRGGGAGPLLSDPRLRPDLRRRRRCARCRSDAGIDLFAGHRARDAPGAEAALRGGELSGQPDRRSPSGSISTSGW